MNRAPFTRSTPMKRSAWPRKQVATVKKEPYQALAHVVRAVVAIKKDTASPKIAGFVATVRPIPKAHPVRNEAYRRAVASLPCVICGVPGYSQAAHGSAGKGMGLKACDMTLFPACCDRPGVRGCHGQLDQGALFKKAVRHELEPVWAADTQRQIMALGLWPKNMPNQALVPANLTQAAINTGAQE